MKLIKLMLAAMMALALVAAQTGNQDDCGFRFHDDGSVDVSRPDGSPRTLQLGEFSINQSNGSLTVNKEGEPDNGATITPPPCGEHGDGPDWLPFEDVDADNDGLISRDEARDKYGTDPEGNDVEDFDQKFDDVDTDNNGSIDPGEYYAAQSSDQDSDPNNN